MIRDFLNPIQLYHTSYKEVRIGHAHDGGYIFLDELCKNTKRIYSFGVERDATFEEDFCKKYNPDCIFMFDHTIDSLPYGGERGFTKKIDKCIWVKKGIGPKAEGDFTTLETELEINNEFLNPEEHILLKMDVEGAEWESILATPDEVLTRFSQIGMELHELQRIAPGTGRCIQNRTFCEPLNAEESQVRVDVIKKLLKNFYMFHAHANNGFPTQLNGGLLVAPIIEISLVRKDLVNPSPVKWSYKEIDSPNNHNLPEVYLNMWPFIR